MQEKDKKKYSEAISEFSILWLEWMKAYNISINEKLSFKERREGGELCEVLIKKRYENIELINTYFEKNICQ